MIYNKREYKQTTTDNNLPNTPISLNDAIRERYDNQINKLNKDIENYKKQIKIRNDEINHYLKEQENLEKNINKNTKELRKENNKLEDLEFELYTQNALLENLNDHYEVMERMRQSLGLPEDFYDAFNIDDAPRRRLNNLSAGFGNYVGETLDLAYLYEEEGRPIETIQEDINKLRDTIHSLNVSIDSDNSRISSLNDTIRNHKEQRDWNMGQYHASQDRISFLKKNKPNKDKKN